MIGLVNDIESTISLDAWIDLLGVVLTVILSAIVSNAVAKKNIKSQQENLDKQIDAEIQKLKIQYKYEQQRDNTNFINKLELEKLSELYELTARYGRLSNQIILAFKHLIRIKEEDRTEEDFDQYFKLRDHYEQELDNQNISRSITILINFVPDLRREWEDISKFQLRVSLTYPHQILGNKINKRYFEYEELPEHYTLSEYEEDADRFLIMTNGMLEKISERTSEVVRSMRKM